MAEQAQAASGVQELIARIRDDGVQAGQEEANRILAEARSEAGRLVADARAEAEEMREKASADIQSHEHAAIEALKLAARDTTLQLQAEVMAAFARHVKRLVTPATNDGSFVKALVLVLAGQAVEEHLKDKPLQILVSDLVAGNDRENPELDQTLREGVLGISREMLREGVELVSSDEVQGGARVRLVGENIEIDLTDETVTELLMRHLLPRYRAIISGEE